MASAPVLIISAIIAMAFCVQCAFGNVVCENLNKDTCSYAVSSSGKRCVLEKLVRRGCGNEAYTCRTSEIKAVDRLKDLIETDECIGACGLDRNALGISSDSLLDSQFTQKLCSSPCYHNCRNIVDLYFTLAAAEGVYLPKLCKAQGANARREMAEIRSSGFAAPAPESGGVKPVSFSISPALPPFTS